MASDERKARPSVVFVNETIPGFTHWANAEQLVLSIKIFEDDRKLKVSESSYQ